MPIFLFPYVNLVRYNTCCLKLEKIDLEYLYNYVIALHVQELGLWCCQTYQWSRINRSSRYFSMCIMIRALKMLVFFDLRPRENYLRFLDWIFHFHSDEIMYIVYSKQIRIKVPFIKDVHSRFCQSLTPSPKTLTRDKDATNLL